MRVDHTGYRTGRKISERVSESIRKGLSLVIDTNQEYDVKNLLARRRNPKLIDPNTFKAYQVSNQQKSFSILLGTISIYLLFIVSRVRMMIFARPGAYNSVRGG